MKNLPSGEADGGQRAGHRDPVHQVQERDENDGPDALQPLPQDQRQAGRHQHHPRPGDETHALQVLYQQHTVLYKLPVSSDTVFSKRFRGVIKNGHKNQK